MPPTNKNAKRKAEPVASTSASTTCKKAKTQKPFPGKIGWSLTIAQLREEAEARGIDLGNVKGDKHSLLGVLGEGSHSVIALNRKQNAKAPSQSKKSESSTSSRATKETKASKPNPTKPNPTTPKKKAAAAEAAAKPAAQLATDKSKKPKLTSAGASAKAPSQKKMTTSTSSAKTKEPLKETKASSNSTSSNIKPQWIIKKGSALKYTNVAPSSDEAPQPTKLNSSVTAGAATKPSASTKYNSAPAPKKKSSTTVPSSAAKPEDYPRISNKLTLAQLREEAIARQMDLKKLPKLKADLLHRLVEGSIHVKETTIYKDYQHLLAKVAGEKERLFKESLKKKQATEQRKEALRREKYAKEEKLRKEEERQRQEERKREKESQKALHTHFFPQVHRHPLANTKDLRTHGGLRNGRCDLCDNRLTPHGYRRAFSLFSQPNPAIYTCEECDWDICDECFQMENKSDAEKKRIRLEEQKKAEAARRQEEEEERRREEAMRNRWDARKRFKANTIKPPAKNKNISSKLKYTVWCSDGYDNDGWHSYEGEPTKEFDTTWSTKKEANERAEYLFFWNNVWGLAPNEVSDDYHNAEDMQPSENDAMQKWTVSPPDSSRWTVGVVPTEAYLHLENASQRRHNYDDEREPQGYEVSYGLCY